jgi:glutaconate CoA-transferase subunit A
MGVPFLPTKSLLGSDLLELNGAKTMDDPFTGERVCLVPALAPDVALIHVQRADAAGNAQIGGAPYMDRELAGAAKRVIVTTEELVASEEIVATADRTAIPHFLVDAVVPVPFGSFPHECYGHYEASFEHFDLYQRMIDEGGDEGARAYVRRFVHDAGSFQGFLDAIGQEVLGEQRRRALELVP